MLVFRNILPTYETDEPKVFQFSIGFPYIKKLMIRELTQQI